MKRNRSGIAHRLILLACTRNPLYIRIAIAISISTLNNKRIPLDFQIQKPLNPIQIDSKAKLFHQ